MARKKKKKRVNKNTSKRPIETPNNNTNNNPSIETQDNKNVFKESSNNKPEYNVTETNEIPVTKTLNINEIKDNETTGNDPKPNDYYIHEQPVIIEESPEPDDVIESDLPASSELLPTRETENKKLDLSNIKFVDDINNYGIELELMGMISESLKQKESQILELDDQTEMQQVRANIHVAFMTLKRLHRF